jgi:DNA-binding NarL/FixJ family response regulator
VDESAPSLISNGGRVLSPILPRLNQLQTVDDPHPAPVYGASISEPLPQRTLNVLVADPQPVVLAGVAALLGSIERVRIVGEARNGREAMDRFLATKPDVGIFEVQMPLLGGIEAMAVILRQVPEARLVMFTTCQSTEDVYRAVRAGARARLARRIVERELTTREREVLVGITNGKSNKEIGVVLNISESTVKVHVTHILEKLRASGRTDAIRVAVQRGLVHFDFANVA